MRIIGFDKFGAKLQNLPKVVMAEIDREIEDSADHWVELAKKDAPVDQGRLRNEIRAVEKGSHTYEIISGVEYSAYVEWGTKTKVKVPADIAGYAAQFRGGTGAGNAKEMIYAWMKRVGIPESAQYWVFISIIVTGINPHPYFFIQRPIVEKELIANISRILNSEH